MGSSRPDPVQEGTLLEKGLLERGLLEERLWEEGLLEYKSAFRNEMCFFLMEKEPFAFLGKRVGVLVRVLLSRFHVRPGTASLAVPPAASPRQRAPSRRRRGSRTHGMPALVPAACSAEERLHDWLPCVLLGGLTPVTAAGRRPRAGCGNAPLARSSARLIVGSA